MTPTTKEEWATITECSVKIKYLEEIVKELKQEIRNKKKEKVESQRHMSNRRLTICLTIASISGAVVVKIFEWLSDLLT